MVTRREFLQKSSLIALAPTVPGFLAQTAHAVTPMRDDRILVVIQLDGGNDGINTVVPFRDEGYARNRAELRLPTDRLHRVSLDIGLHPAMREAVRLFEDRRLAIVQGVGYPNPSRSHFKSMAIWQSANIALPRGEDNDAESRATYGWLGRALDESRGRSDALFVGERALPIALRSRRSVASAIARPEDSLLTLRTPHSTTNTERSDDLAAFVRRSTLDAYATSERMATVLRADERQETYPATALANNLRIIARFIKGNLGTRVFYTVQGGYDTHSVQLEQHAGLLRELSGALAAFLNDMQAARLEERVLVLCFSEFGRRVQENNSRGTDHGTAGPVLLAGSRLRGGLTGDTPRLNDLEEGDLKMTVDFRRVYATVLEDWLSVPRKPILGGGIEKLELLRI